MCHGWIEDGEIVCYDDEKISYSGSKKVGESIFWTKDKKPIGLS